MIKELAICMAMAVLIWYVSSIISVDVDVDEAQVIEVRETLENWTGQDIPKGCRLVCEENG